MTISKTKMANSSYCILVDPFVSSDAIITALAKVSIACIAVITLNNVPTVEKKRRLHGNHFAEIFYVEDNNIDTIVNKLRNFSIVSVIPNNERSLNFAEQLAARLIPQYANNPTSSHLRNNKYEMQEAVRKFQLNAVAQIKSNIPALTQTQKSLVESWRFPVVVKPCDQSGSFGVHICNTLVEVEATLTTILGQVSNYGTRVENVVIQQSLQGDEYFVDTFSVNGQAHLSGVYRYDKIKINNRYIYRVLEAVNPNSLIAQQCIDYVSKVLSAVELHEGFAHTEIFMTAQGPVLVEVNPRISGAHGFVNKLAELCFARGQARLLADFLGNTTYFLETYHKPQDLQQCGKIIFLQNWQLNKKFQGLNVDMFAQLASYQDHIILKDNGIELSIPQTLTDSVALLLLANKDKTLLDNDTAQIFLWEKNAELFT